MKKKVRNDEKNFFFAFFHPKGKCRQTWLYRAIRIMDQRIKEKSWKLHSPKKKKIGKLLWGEINRREDSDKNNDDLKLFENVWFK